MRPSTHCLPLLTLLVTLLCTTSVASAKETGGAIHGELGARLALGDWGDVSGPGFGGTLGIHYTVVPNLTLTGRIGYFAGLPRDQGDFFGIVEARSKTNELPILIGARGYLPGGSDRGALWGGLELGMTQLELKSWLEDNGGNRDFIGENRELEPTVVLGLGYDMGQINPHLALHWIPLEDSDDFVAIVLTLGFDLLTSSPP